MKRIRGTKIRRINTPQHGELDALEGEGLVIRHVPMKHVHLVDFHQVQRLEDHGLGEEMPGGVDHETTVRKPGPVKYVRRIQQKLEKYPNISIIIITHNEWSLSHSSGIYTGQELCEI